MGTMVGVREGVAPRHIMEFGHVSGALNSGPWTTAPPMPPGPDLRWYDGGAVR